jgi:hypothetical protein
MTLDNEYLTHIRLYESIAALREATESLRQEMTLRSESHERVHVEADRAVTISATNIDIRLQQMNKFRDAMADQTERFVTKDYAETMMTGILTRLEAMNEFRAQLSDQARAFVQVSTLDLVRQETDRRQSEMDSRIRQLEQGEANIQGRLWAVGAIVGAVSLAVGIGLRFV